MEYFTYILFSHSRQQFYIGQTQNLQKRLSAHNKGYVRSTKSGKPWKLIFSKSCSSRAQAFRLEAKLKSFKSQAQLKQWIINHPDPG